ncbi:hypothetical protein [Flavobacterium sp.]|jgi:hypothetical protein|uniref:hypothetical protein n=1 Tax=Flavobacterium sp. TaxID=239 RepID=UPI0037BFE173
MLNTDLYKIIAIPEANIDLAGIETSVLLKNENKALRRAIYIGLSIGLITIIYLNNKNERREEN